MLPSTGDVFKNKTRHAHHDPLTATLAPTHTLTPPNPIESPPTKTRAPVVACRSAPPPAPPYNPLTGVSHTHLPSVSRARFLLTDGLPLFAGCRLVSLHATARGRPAPSGGYEPAPLTACRRPCACCRDPPWQVIGDGRVEGTGFRAGGLVFRV